MGQTNRPMPVRADLWRPEDRVLDSIIRRRVAEAESAEDGAGTSTTMAGAMVVAVLGVLIFIGAGSVAAAIIVPGILALAGIFYVLNSAGPAPTDRSGALRELGGPGGLPAGYLVHPDAWEAGMAEHVAYVPESQLQAAVQLSRFFPGTVDDLMSFTSTIAAQLPATRHATTADVEKRTKELVRVATPILRNHALTTGK